MCVLTVLATVAVVLAASPWGFATPSITFLGSSAPGVYDYGLTLANESVSFLQNATITLSGLSDVTGASSNPLDLLNCFTVSSVTSSSVEYAETAGSCLFAGPTTDGTLTVDSSVLTLGTVDFSMQPSTGTVTGMTQGPVAASVPEPAGVVLLGTALLGLVGFVRRKGSR
jgi:hypothetical protein